jgi:hypothetical protein
VEIAVHSGYNALRMANDYTLRVFDSILGLLSSEENPTPLVRLNTDHQYDDAFVDAMTDQLLEFLKR